MENIFGYDFRTGLKQGMDPDKYSKELKEAHIFLWSKPFPNGTQYTFSIKNNAIVANENEALDFNPDSFTNSMRNNKRIVVDLSNNNRIPFSSLVEGWKVNPIIKELLDEYVRIDYCIGSSIIFPIKDDNGNTKWTINKARGCLYSVQDRTDYTLECIRRYFLGNQDSPLKSCLNRYSFFFSLFGNGKEGFVNYVKWFYLDDLVNDDYSEVPPFNSTIDFDNPFPLTEEEYIGYMNSIIHFIKSREERMEKSFGYTKENKDD